MRSIQLPPIINIMEKAAREAGKKLIRDFGEIEKLQVSSKSLGDFVTNSDIGAEKSIYKTLSYYYPDYSFIMEESGKVEGKENNNIFVVDPIDGTSNFIHGIPHFCIAIAKLTNNEITEGVIYNPVLNEFYWSSKGNGAWLNNQRLRVSNRNKLESCLIGTTSIKKNPEALKKITKFINEGASIRSIGSAALDLAFVASGRFDAFWQTNLNLWDIASGVLLVLEAGGKVSQPNGEAWETNSTGIVASNSVLHEKIIEYIGF